ncbi:hypothetical protein B0H34DRAFT_195194 [Crassisporium funariophilum]|nr:hypothetical protein B0H34DRAFT_195194 [Crassisporium funariophilum]
MVSPTQFLRLGLIATQSALAASLNSLSPSSQTSQKTNTESENSVSERRTSSLSEMQHLQSRIPDVGRCWKDHCWAWCTDQAFEFWCYTTRGSTFDGQYVGCTKAYECQGVTTCAGPCGV